MLPLLRVIASEPEALAEHAAAYADLAGDELQRLQAQWGRRALWFVVSAVAGFTALLLGGVALMLWAVVPPRDGAPVWLLLAVPLLPLAVAVGAAWIAHRQSAAPPFAVLRAQLREDLDLVREGIAR